MYSEVKQIGFRHSSNYVQYVAAIPSFCAQEGSLPERYGYEEKATMPVGENLTL